MQDGIAHALEAEPLILVAPNLDVRGDLESAQKMLCFAGDHELDGDLFGAVVLEQLVDDERHLDGGDRAGGSDQDVNFFVVLLLEELGEGHLRAYKRVDDGLVGVVILLGRRGGGRVMLVLGFEEDEVARHVDGVLARRRVGGVREAVFVVAGGRGRGRGLRLVAERDRRGSG